MTKTSLRMPTDAQLAFMDELKTALVKHKDVEPVVMLALASQLVGMLILCQDQTRFNKDSIMTLVASNIEIGNRTAVGAIFGETHGNA